MLKAAIKRKRIVKRICYTITLYEYAILFII